MDKVEHLLMMHENHNQIILKHETMLKEMLTLSMYKAKNDTFLKETENRVQNTLFVFNNTLGK